MATPLGERVTVSAAAYDLHVEDRYIASRQLRGLDESNDYYH